MRTFNFLAAAFLAVSFVGSAAFADANNCQTKIAEKRNALTQAEDKYAVGEITLIELIDARLGLSDQNRECGLTSKPNFCKYTQNLLAAKIRALSEVETGESRPQTDAAQLRLDETVSYCKSSRP